MSLTMWLLPFDWKKFSKKLKALKEIAKNWFNSNGPIKKTSNSEYQVVNVYVAIAREQLLTSLWSFWMSRFQHWIWLHVFDTVRVAWIAATSRDYFCLCYPRQERRPLSPCRIGFCYERWEIVNQELQLISCWTYQSLRCNLYWRI